MNWIINHKYKLSKYCTVSNQELFLFQAQKAILDQELDLITHQNTGEDTTELKKKVEELKQEVLYLFT